MEEYFIEGDKTSHAQMILKNRMWLPDVTKRNVIMEI